MRLKEATQGYCSVSRWGDETMMNEEKGHGHQDETRAHSDAAGQRRPELTAAALRRIGLSESCEGSLHVAQFLPINSFVHILVFYMLGMWVLKCLNSNEGKKNSLKAGSGSVLNNGKVCIPQQKDKQTDATNDNNSCKENFILWNRKKPWEEPVPFRDFPGDWQVKEEEKER